MVPEGSRAWTLGHVTAQNKLGFIFDQGKEWSKTIPRPCAGTERRGTTYFCVHKSGDKSHFDKHQERHRASDDHDERLERLGGSMGRALDSTTMDDVR
jgi:hypothetical protein